MPLVPHVSTGQIIASTWGNNVADQVVMRFTTAAQRASQLTAPIVDQLTTRDDQPGVLERWNGTAWVPVVTPRELGYAEATASKTITATVETSADLVVAGPSITLDGTTAVLIELQAAALAPPAAAGANLFVWLYRNGASIGRIAAAVNPTAAALFVPFYAARRYTPPAGANQFSFAATVSGGSGQVVASTGGLGQYMPASIRITRAA